MAVAVVAVLVVDDEDDPCILQRAWYRHGHVAVAGVEFVFLN